MDRFERADDAAAAIVDTAVKLHIQVGPGLLESVYETVLASRLSQRGLSVERQKRVALELDGIRFAEGFRIDLLVDQSVVVEVKSVETLLPVHSKQLLTYLRLTGLSVGLLINFGAPTLGTGIKRVVNGFAPSSISRLRVNRSSDRKTLA
jgi:iron complex transport system substrate-binding protein